MKKVNGKNQQADRKTKLTSITVKVEINIRKRIRQLIPEGAEGS